MNWVNQLRKRVSLATILTVCAIALPVGIFFFPLLLGQGYFLDDLKIIYYPLEHRYAEFQNNWSLPQWDPTFGFGHPLIAWGQLGFFNPVHAILRLLQIHPIILLQLSLVIFFTLGAIGMYVLLRRHKLIPAAAVLGSVLFVLCGFHIGHLNHVNFYTATMWLPWLLIAIHAFLHHPTFNRTALLAITAAVIPLSGQPQISLYTFVIGAIYGVCIAIESLQHKAIQQNIVRYMTRVISGTFIAGVAAFLLASTALLPLTEFLPLTERGADLPMAELFEFSYPPYHVITLIFPYFFGDHSIYWGAKNFQELAAYTGIIPLILAGSALLAWRKHTSIKVFGLILFIIAPLFALGIYSPLYRWLVESHIITGLNIPGRFVFFFNVAIVFLSAIGLHSLSEKNKRLVRMLSVAGAVLLPILLFLPFFLQLSQFPLIQQRWEELVHLRSTPVLLVIGGIVMAGVSYTLLLLRRFQTLATWLLTLASAATLLVYGWNYNPRTDLALATPASPFTDELQAYEQATGYPARLYGAESLPVGGTTELEQKQTEPISPDFSVRQALTLTPPSSCLTIPFQLERPGGAQAPEDGSLVFSIHDVQNSTLLFEKEITTAELARRPIQQVCLPTTTEDRRISLEFKSQQNSHIKLLYHTAPLNSDSVLFLRVQNPTPDQLSRSQKPAQLTLQQNSPDTISLDKALLVRHLQATAGASSARWIGALSFTDWRMFIEDFFANDREPLDGDGQHVLVRNRSLFNMSGVTHFTQSIPADALNDSMADAGFPIVAEEKIGTRLVRLYENPQAFPKAFVVPNSIYQPATDETRVAMKDPFFNPRQTVYISGDAPPFEETVLDNTPPQANTTITHYSPTRVELNVTTSRSGWLVVTDTTSPEWKVSVNGMQSPYYVANTMFKTTWVPSGTSKIVFTYESPAIQKSKIFTIIGFIIVIALLVIPAARKFAAIPNRT